MAQKGDTGESASRDSSRDDDVDATAGPDAGITSETTDKEAAKDRDGG